MDPDRKPFKESREEEKPELKVGEPAFEDRTVSSIGEPDAPAKQAELQAGENFEGKFAIEGKLGTGGMGVVYRARDLTLNRTVAIKVLSAPGLANQKAILRFQQEARAAGALGHPGIVSVHEFAVSDAGEPYIVMDCVEGQALSDAIARAGCLPLDTCLDIAIRAAEALEFAHAKGVVHRDLKPANIMLINDGGDGESIKIVDFGIAKIQDEEGKALTKTGEVFGSPLYMSPEQCSGARVDRRSDIYSLACVLYETLAGRPPHNGETALATAVMHLQEEPDPLSAVRPDRDFPAPLQVILDRALAKDPDSRYQSMSELRSDLEKLREGKPDEVMARSAASKQRRILNALKQRLAIFLGVVSLVSATFAGNPTISGALYLAGGLMIVFAIPGLRGDGPVSVALRRQSRDSIPISRGELIAWMILIPLLLGLAYLYFQK
ncbi:MAG: serine/threonine protein kinase [Candidatus Melainabacteria bacterium]|nr:serine/threonine protein kinase [Candidatus Melainabacteria bacterium]